MCTIYLTHFTHTANKKYQTEHNVGLQLLSHALFDYANISMDASDLPSQIEKGSHGKPFLASHENLHYNISHCSDMVACAISHAPVGVDIEEIRDFPEHILRRVLTDDEKAFLNQVGTDSISRNEWFYRLWTLKESRIKHSGMGLAMDLTSFSFTYDLKLEPYAISCSDDGLSFFQQIVEERYVLSLCTESSVKNIRVVLL